MTDNYECGVELELDSSCDSVENQRGETAENDVLLESGVQDVASLAEQEKILDGDPRADKAHHYMVYDDECYQSGSEEWRSKNKFVSVMDETAEQEERQYLVGDRERIAEDFLNAINNLRSGELYEQICERLKRNKKTENDDKPAHFESLKVNLDPMTISDELNEVAKAVWMERTSVPDGFIVLPEHRITRDGKTYGCMVFCTPKTDEFSSYWLGRFATYYWLFDAKPVESTLKKILPTEAFQRTGLEPAFHFPHSVWPNKKVQVQPSNYPYDDEKAQGLFAVQLAVPDCRRLGVYFDMVQVADCVAWGVEHPVKNLACVVAVFEKPLEEKKD